MGFKVFHLVSREESRREGTLKIIGELRTVLEDEGFDVTNKLVKDADLYHIFSNGFYEAIRYKEVSEKAIYSLLTNIEFPTKGTIRWFKEALQEKREKNYITSIGNIIAASCVPSDLKRKAIEGYRHVTVPTQHMKNSLKIKKSRVIPLGIDHEEFQNIKEGAGVAFFGAPASVKGYPDLYEAAKLLDKKLPVRFYFRSREEKMSKLMEGLNIEVLGLQENIVEAYNENSIIVLPFRLGVGSLGIPLTLIEAMACERAIVTTNLPHLKEIGGDSVLYVDPRAPEQIKEKIEMLLDDKQLRNKLGKKARARVLENYTEKHMFEGFLSLYGEAINKQ